MNDEQSKLASALSPIRYDATGLAQSLRSSGPNSALLTSGIIIADVVGAGILSMPVAVAQFGWLLGTVMILLLLAMNVHISILLWRVRMDNPGSNTLLDLTEAAFKRAPERQRNAIVSMTLVGQYGYLVSLLALYTLAIGKALGMAFYHVRRCLPWWCILACLILLPFQATARMLGTWKNLVWINVATIVGSVLIPLAYMASQGVETIRPASAVMSAVMPLNFNGTLSGVSLMCFAFTSQFMLVEIMSEMKDLSEFPKAYIRLSAPFQGLAFLVTGLGGYYFLGNSAKGMIGDNIPFGLTFRAAALCLCTHMLITYLLKGVVVCSAAYKRLGKDTAGSWNGIVVGLLVVTWIVAQVVPFFSEFVDLLGACMTPLICYVLPVAMYIRWEHDTPADQRGAPRGLFERVIIWAEVALSLFLFVFGTCVALGNIYQNWATFGGPFQCHCEGIWNTCECSAGHQGMDACPATNFMLGPQAAGGVINRCQGLLGAAWRSTARQVPLGSGAGG